MHDGKIKIADKVMIDVDVERIGEKLHHCVSKQMRKTVGERKLLKIKVIIRSIFVQLMNLTMVRNKRK